MENVLLPLSFRSVFVFEVEYRNSQRPEGATLPTK